jgi:hypothetical protein
MRKSLLTLLIPFALVGCGPETPINEIELTGFDHLLNQGYELNLVDIPTDGNIESIARTARIDSTFSDYTITFTGEFKYTITQEKKFMPKDSYHSDGEGNSPYNSEEAWENYRTDIREGKIEFKLKEEAKDPHIIN